MKKHSLPLAKRHLSRLISFRLHYLPYWLDSIPNKKILVITSQDRVVDDFMQNNCWCGLVGEMEVPAEVDTVLRATAARNQVPSEHLLVIGWMDLTKIGVLGQKDVNKVAHWCEKIVSKNPTGLLA